ncbi:WD40 repeat-like protein, partial [Vararia minispora EC-137]
SGDGSVRVYHPPEKRVIKAIHGLGDEVSSLALSRNSHGQQENGRVWIASGTHARLFDLGLDKLLLSVSDASDCFKVGEEDDLLNEIAVSFNGKTIAFSIDSGAVGVVDVPSRRIRRMKTRHANICGSVSFIPERQKELVSGGYDSALLHFDHTLGNISSRKDFAAISQTPGISLSPPFILCLSVSSNAIIAAGTADGHLWIGCGGEAQTPGAKKAKKWLGLDETRGMSIKVAEGPVVAVKFIDDTKILACTLLGMLVLHTLSNEDGQSPFAVTRLWAMQAPRDLAKVNALAITDAAFAIGGLDKNGKGVVCIIPRHLRNAETVER